MRILPLFDMLLSVGPVLFPGIYFFPICSIVVMVLVCASSKDIFVLYRHLHTLNMLSGYCREPLLQESLKFYDRYFSHFNSSSTLIVSIATTRQLWHQTYCKDNVDAVQILQLDRRRSGRVRLCHEQHSPFR